MGSLIWESPAPISLEMSEETRMGRYESFLNDIAQESYKCEILANFLAANADGFFENKTVVDYIIPDGTTIPAGMRIGKALHRYFDELIGDARVEEVRNEMSRIIQENKVVGTLCLSVHPLDFLSSSENQHNWRSCHALDGDYRAGNLSYMTDDCTIMAYLRSDNDVTLPNFPEEVPWNNKKWRCLFFFDRKSHIVYEGRQYPYAMPDILNKMTQAFIAFDFFTHDKRYVLDAWRDNVFTNFTANGHTYDTARHAFFPSHGILPLEKIVTDHRDSFHFNDLLKSSFYLPKTYDYDLSWFGNTHRFKEPMVVGGYTPCVRCGNDAVIDSNKMVCCRCADVLDGTDEYAEDCEYCYLCGDAANADEMTYIEGMYPYCPECINEAEVQDVLARCDECNSLIDTRNPYRSRQFIGTNGVARCGCCMRPSTPANRTIDLFV